MKKYVMIGFSIFLAFFISSCDLNLFSSFEQVPFSSSDDLNTGLTDGGVTVNDDGEITDLKESVTVDAVTGTVSLSKEIQDYTRSIGEMVDYGTIDDFSDDDKKAAAENLKKIAEEIVTQLSDDTGEANDNISDEVREIVQEASGISMDLQVASNEDVKNFITGTSDILVDLLNSLGDSEDSRSVDSSRALEEGDGTTYDYLSEIGEFPFGESESYAFDEFAGKLYEFYGDDKIGETELSEFKENLNARLETPAQNGDNLEISLLDLLQLFPAEAASGAFNIVNSIVVKFPLDDTDDFEKFLNTFKKINDTAKQFFWSIHIEENGELSGMSTAYYDAEEERFTARAKNIALRAMLALVFSAFDDEEEGDALANLLSALGTTEGVTIVPSDAGTTKNMKVTIDIDENDIETVISSDFESMFTEGSSEENRMKKAAAVLGFYSLLFSDDTNEQEAAQ